jgi:hypothetical protein
MVSDALQPDIRDMVHYRYKVGQRVVAVSGRDALLPSGPYIIVSLLPLVGREPHYRVRSTVDGHERALLEGQLWLVFQEPKTREAATGKVGRERR